MSAKKTTTSTITTSDEARIDIKTYAMLLENRWRTRATKLRPLNVTGHMGISKSQVVYQVCEKLTKELGHPVTAMCLSMHCMESPDFSGLSYISDGRTLFGHPHLLPKDGYGILFLDEINRAPKDLLQAALTLIENREINGHKLGDGWIICCAGNPGSDSSDVLYAVKELDPALKSRLCAYTLSPKAVEIIDYLATKYGESNQIVRWMRSEPQIVSLDGTGTTNPRAMEYLIRSLEANKGLDRFTVMSGEIGNSATVQFQKYLSSPASVDIERLLAMDEETKAMMRGFHDSRKKALEEGKINDVSIVNSWIDMMYNHVNNIKKDCDAKGVPFTLTDRPELARSLGRFMLSLEVFEWASAFTSRIGWLHVDKERIQKDLLGPILAGTPELREQLKKIFAESIKRDEAEVAKKKKEDEAAAKKVAKEATKEATKEVAKAKK